MNKNKISAIILIALKLWAGYIFLMEGFEKFESLDRLIGRSSPFIDFYLAMGETSYLLPLIGVVEIVGAILLISQRYSFAGALFLFPVALNVSLAHIFLIQSSKGIMLTSALMAILLICILSEYSRLKTLVKGQVIWPKKS